jgi:hypothetical protein
MLAVAETAHAQSRGVYPLGMTAVGSGVTPDPGFTYANQLLFYSRDESKADDGSTLPVSGQNAVIMDMNSFVWVSRRTFLEARTTRPSRRCRSRRISWSPISTGS